MYYTILLAFCLLFHIFILSILFYPSNMAVRKKFASAVNFYVTDTQKKKIEYILEQKGQSLTDFLRGHIQTTVEKYEDKNGAINVYQTYIV
ncbi:hypothetical protein AUK10_02215 [Candidatus Gracilibacteria bacterium CG2_30_37_12]|nr:MAG: hypothetical protein AUK10_02215 [Candidatus Gracilibacteria bacterium CG2_30_37_12]